MDIVSLIPTGILATIGGAFVTVTGAVIAHKLKSIPFKILLGEENKNGKTTITAEMLEKNCKYFHAPLVDKISEIYDRQTDVISNQKQTNKRIDDFMLQLVNQNRSRNG